MTFDDVRKDKEKKATNWHILEMKFINKRRKSERIISSNKKKRRKEDVEMP